MSNNLYSDYIMNSDNSAIQSKNNQFKECATKCGTIHNPSILEAEKDQILSSRLPWAT